MKSMTGYGEARAVVGKNTVEVELRSVNHRFFKLNAAIPDYMKRREGEIEEMVQSELSRGVVDLRVRVLGPASDEAMVVDPVVLDSYVKSLKKFDGRSGISADFELEWLVNLPGVLRPRSDIGSCAEKMWPPVRRTLASALKSLSETRLREGARLRKALDREMAEMRRLIDRIRAIAPSLPQAHVERLTKRIEMLLARNDFKLGKEEMLKEVGLAAERCDIAEETDRFDAHLKEFASVLEGPNDIGKRLDFLTQEMLRETNTIATKAGDARVSHLVVRMKTAIERLKEQVQNIQ
jgi:uncharacterized protein (TIGR00255 family)